MSVWEAKPALCRGVREIGRLLPAEIEALAKVCDTYGLFRANETITHAAASFLFCPTYYQQRTYQIGELITSLGEGCQFGALTDHWHMDNVDGTGLLAMVICVVGGCGTYVQDEYGQAMVLDQNTIYVLDSTVCHKSPPMENHNRRKFFRTWVTAWKALKE